jgi:hypothetical protein
MPTTSLNDIQGYGPSTGTGQSLDDIASPPPDELPEVVATAEGMASCEDQRALKTPSPEWLRAQRKRHGNVMAMLP